MADLTLRAIQPADLHAVCQVMLRSNLTDGVPEVPTVEELSEELDDERVVLATDTRVAVEEGVVVGVSYTYHLPSEVREERCYVFGWVDPAHRGRSIGSRLLEWGLARAAEQLRSTRRDLPLRLRVNAPATAADAHRLFVDHGLRPVRWFETLLRPTTPALPHREPDGVRLAPWPDGRDDEIRVVKNLAFADHWGSTPTDPLHWHQMVRGHGARPDLSFVALDDDQRVVALCVNKRFPDDDAVTGRSEGCITTLGTLSGWRGRGVASALVARSLRAFVDAGLSHALIEVDGESPTGASRLYRSLGFEPLRGSVTHEVTLPNTLT